MLGRLPTVAVVVFLTLLTQIGGLIWLLSLCITRPWRKRIGFAGFLVLFASLYAAGSTLSHAVAPIFGRVPLPCFDNASRLRMQSSLYCLLNRQYVVPRLREAALALSRQMDQVFPETTTLALDGNFPFFDGFPLLPHLSHSDGRKLDVAFYYQDNEGRFLDKATRSPVGYFAFEQPGENSALPCEDRRDILTLRWDLHVLQALWRPLSLEEKRTREALRWLSDEGQGFGVEKIFVEPHLAQRLGVSAENIKFQGCRAARHDDHIHMQVAK
ncbi:hypothetical protein QN219_15765 [Sinorhizobium sp. 7-81]|uniref:hypothetical protein n=1 Tax=Sinorhizobium sp. 8-89 TaxID=3049089 RepID=UPI0024C40333|nr:hypothetical protein [Sinorhizobium sp. 8-89]MDK1491500.1 hypothetical protein [Sinorhizobium sp. 8-89]